MNEQARLAFRNLVSVMSVLYAGLARFEKGRMEERFAEDYHGFAASRGRFFPGSPMHRLFEKTFGRMRPRFLGWLGAYGACLIARLRPPRLHSSQPVDSDSARAKRLVVSAWPLPEAWMEGVFEATLAGSGAPKALQKNRGEGPAIVTILPPRYRMGKMFHKVPSRSRPDRAHRCRVSLDGPNSGRLLGAGPRSDSAERLDGDRSGHDAELLQLVFSRAEKSPQEELRSRRSDPGVRVKPFLVVDVIPAMGDVTQVLRPLPQNAWGGRSSDRTAEILASQRLDAVRRRKRCKRDRKEPHENCHHRHHFGADSLDRAVLNRFLQVPEPVPPTLKPVAFEGDLCRTYKGASRDRPQRTREGLAGFLLRRCWRPTERAHRKYTIRRPTSPFAC